MKIKNIYFESNCDEKKETTKPLLQQRNYENPCRRMKLRGAVATRMKLREALARTKLREAVGNIRRMKLRERKQTTRP